MQNKATATLYLIQSHDGMNVDSLPLPEPQRLKADGLSGKRKIEYSLGRLLLINALNTSRHNTPRIIEQEQGPPSIEFDDAEFNQPIFSISHSKGWVGLIFCESESTLELGLDIEKIKPGLNEKQAAYFCNKRQILAAQDLTAIAKSEYFTQLWTHKEAFCKSLGLSVLSKQSKAADFSQNTLMRSTLLNRQHFISVYSNSEIEIETCFLTLDRGGVLSKDEALTLNWNLELNAC